MRIFFDVNRLDLSIVLVGTQVLLLGIHVVLVNRKSVNLDWEHSVDYVPVDVLLARRLRHRSFVDPSLLVVDFVEHVPDIEHGGHLVLVILKFELSEEVLKSLVISLVNWIELLHTEHKNSGCIINFGFVSAVSVLVVNYHFQVEVVAINCVLCWVFQNQMSRLEAG